MPGAEARNDWDDRSIRSRVTARRRLTASAHRAAEMGADDRSMCAWKVFSQHIDALSREDGTAFGIRLNFGPDYLRLSFADATSGSVKSNAIADQLDAPSEAN